MDNSAYIDLLDENLLSNTKSRRIIFHILSSSQKPLSLIELVAKTSGSMNKTTVYRTIDLFEKIGIVKRVTTGWKQSYELSDAFFRHHHHMTCIVCSKVISFEESYKLLAEIERLEEAYRFIVDEHTIELRGRCNSCRV